MATRKSVIERLENAKRSKHDANVALNRIKLEMKKLRADMKDYKYLITVADHEIATREQQLGYTYQPSAEFYNDCPPKTNA